MLSFFSAIQTLPYMQNFDDRPNDLTQGDIDVIWRYTQTPTLKRAAGDETGPNTNDNGYMYATCIENKHYAHDFNEDESPFGYGQVSNNSDLYHDNGDLYAVLELPNIDSSLLTSVSASLCIMFKYYMYGEGVDVLALVKEDPAGEQLFIWAQVSA